MATNYWVLDSSATFTIATTAIPHDGIELEVTEDPILRETMNATNYPYAAKEQDGKKASGSLKFTAKTSGAFPAVGPGKVLAISGDGINFSGNVTISNMQVQAGSDGKSAEISFKFDTDDGDYTLSNTGS